MPQMAPPNTPIICPIILMLTSPLNALALLNFTVSPYAFILLLKSIDKRLKGPFVCCRETI